MLTSVTLRVVDISLGFRILDYNLAAGPATLLLVNGLVARLGGSSMYSPVGGKADGRLLFQSYSSAALSPSMSQGTYNCNCDYTLLSHSLSRAYNSSGFNSLYGYSCNEWTGNGVQGACNNKEYSWPGQMKKIQNYLMQGNFWHTHMTMHKRKGRHWGIFRDFQIDAIFSGNLDLPLSC